MGFLVNKNKQPIVTQRPSTSGDNQNKKDDKTPEEQLYYYFMVQLLNKLMMLSPLKKNSTRFDITEQYMNLNNFINQLLTLFFASNDIEQVIAKGRLLEDTSNKEKIIEYFEHMAERYAPRIADTLKEELNAVIDKIDTKNLELLQMNERTEELEGKIKQLEQKKFEREENLNKLVTEKEQELNSLQEQIALLEQKRAQLLTTVEWVPVNNNNSFLGLSPTVFRGYYDALIKNHSVKMGMSLEDAKTDIIVHSPSLKALDEYMYGKSTSSEY